MRKDHFSRDSIITRHATRFRSPVCLSNFTSNHWLTADWSVPVTWLQSTSWWICCMGCMKETKITFCVNISFFCNKPQISVFYRPSPFLWLLGNSIREYVFYVFFSDFKKTWLFTFFEMTFQKNVKKSQKVSSLLNVYRNFGLKTPGRYGYLLANLSHTVLSCIVSSEQDVWSYHHIILYISKAPVQKHRRRSH